MARGGISNLATFLFVSAGVEHRFEEFTEEFAAVGVYLWAGWGRMNRILYFGQGILLLIENTGNEKTGIDCSTDTLSAWPLPNQF